MPRLADPRFAPDCVIRLDGRAVPARTGESVTSALLAAGRPLIGRSPKYHRPRGPFCLSASCASCLVRVDGVPNVRACEVACRDGQVVETQNALGGAAHDLLGAIDLLSPKGLDHHHLATFNQLANRLAVLATRRLSGLGHPSNRPPDPWRAGAEEGFDAVVVGAGPAGLGAAAALAEGGRRALLCDREGKLGGRLRCRLGLDGDPPLAWAEEVASAVVGSGGEVATRTVAMGLWPCEGGAFAALVESGENRIRLVRSQRWVLACGTWAQPPVFPGNDLPGIHAARGLLVALAEDGVVPGEQVAVLGRGPEAEAAAACFRRVGARAVSVSGDVARARGGRRLAALDLADGSRVHCDSLAVATPRMPAAELAREVGARLALDPETGGFRVDPGSDGRVAPGVVAVGEVTGPCTAAEAVAAGRGCAGEASLG